MHTAHTHTRSDRHNITTSLSYSVYARFSRIGAIRIAVINTERAPRDGAVHTHIEHKDVKSTTTVCVCSVPCTCVEMRHVNSAPERERTFN